MNFAQHIEAYQKSHPLLVKRINGVDFRYTFSGKGGKTLVLLVGGLGLSIAYCNLVFVLEKKYQVITFDFPVVIRRMRNLLIVLSY
ncbi:hypothetical protein EJP82_14700 [Paenibacillus anaericanus]|uniref:Alpha/beta hydrolase n=1 Tax=Paenibacillus anaericanus TaxID=170367 RepID=A0A3S1DUC3_9BACL|nr:hypothetical protein [Paenibacillus anaericanus]RUT45538.1 hypothetical protein EJP82_14700 [Paenibacillus anaericanus]